MPHMEDLPWKNFEVDDPRTEPTTIDFRLIVFMKYYSFNDSK